MGRIKTSTVITHSAAWLFFLSFPTLFLLQINKNCISLYIASPWAILQFAFVFIGIFYLNVYYLFPKFYLQKKYLLYSLSCMALLILVLTIKPFFSMNRNYRALRRASTAAMERPRPTMHFDLMSLLIYMVIIGSGTGMRIKKEWLLTEKRAVQAEADRAKANLSFLKAQINPHFLYNTLNNIYTLCINGHPEAAESIMKLSNIMRYVTDESEANYVSLLGEINCMDNFIELQKLRLSTKTKLSYKIKGDPAGHQISPLILMTFVENVFKYGLSTHHQANINIDLDIHPGKLIFRTCNQRFASPKRQERKGLGISNTKKRLELLYPKKHKLNILEKQDLFSVELTLITKG